MFVYGGVFNKYTMAIGTLSLQRVAQANPHTQNQLLLVSN